MQQHNLNDYNYFLSECDRVIEITLSNIGTLEEECRNSVRKKKVLVNFQDVLCFKIETLYSLAIKLEELVFNTTFAYYRKYHSSTRGELSPVELENIKREVSYIFDSFVTQYKSLLDLVAKFVFEYTFSENPHLLKLPFPDSFGTLLEFVIKKDNSKKFKKTFAALSKTAEFVILQNSVQGLIRNKVSFEEINAYRDYTIHHGYVKHQLVGKSTENHVIFSYLIPYLVRRTRTNYDVDHSKNIRLEYLCREKLFLLLSLIAEITDTLYEDSFKQPYVHKLGTFEPESVKEIILRLAVKGVQADKLLLEEKLKEFLKSKNIEFSELVEDSTYTEKEFESKNKGDDEGSSLLFERITYKPIGNIRVFKTTCIHKGNWKTKIEDKPMYGVIISDISTNDFISQSTALEDIFETLRRAGLLYVTKRKTFADKKEQRYASVREDLKSLVVALNELTNFKWAFIQIPEMDYFRPRTSEETKNTQRILGKDADEYLKKKDEERYRIQNEYKEWKKRPTHYFENVMDVVDKDKKILARITHREFLEEKKLGFQNWKQNQRVEYWDDGQKVETHIVPFLVDKPMDQKWLEKFIKACKKQWKGRPEHFLEFEKKLIRKSRKKYEANVKKAKEEFAPCIKKYSYLTPVFRLLNEDVFA